MFYFLLSIKVFSEVSWHYCKCCTWIKHLLNRFCGWEMGAFETQWKSVVVCRILVTSSLKNKLVAWSINTLIVCAFNREADETNYCDILIPMFSIFFKKSWWALSSDASIIFCRFPINLTRTFTTKKFLI